MPTSKARAVRLIPRHSLFLHNAVYDMRVLCMYDCVLTSYRLHKLSLVRCVCGENMSQKRLLCFLSSESLLPLFKPASLLNIK